MMRNIRKFILAFFIFLVVVIAAAISFAYIYEEEVKSYVVTSLNNNIKTEINVKDVSFSIIKSFPYASLEFKEVLAKEAWQKVEKDTLFYASSVFLKFNIWDVYRKNYKVHELEISDAKVYLKVDEAGTENYRFWEVSDSSGSAFSLDLQKVKAQNVRLEYDNKIKKFSTILLFHDNDLKGNFEQSVFEAEVSSSFLVEQFMIDKTEFFKNKKFEVNGNILIDSQKEKYAFKETMLGIEGIEIVLNGFFSTLNTTYLNVDFSSKNLGISHTLEFLTKEQQQSLQAYKIDGKADVNGTIKGEVEKDKLPLLVMDFSVEDGKFEHLKSKEAFTNVALSGSLTNGEKKNKSSTQLQLSSLNADFGKGNIQGKLDLQNFDRPKFEFEGNLLMDLHELSEFLEWKTIERIEGTAKVQLNTQGYLNKIDGLSIDDWKKAMTSGKIELQDLSFLLKERPQEFRDISGELLLQNNSLKANNLKGMVSNSDFLINGSFINLIGFLLNPNEPLVVDASIYSNKLELNELLLSSEVEESANMEEKNSESYHFAISDRIRIKVKSKIDALTFRKFNIFNSSAEINIQDQVMGIENVHFESMGGTVDGNLIINGQKSEYLTMRSSSQLSNINVQQLFHDFNNFGQEMLTHENLQGVATAEINFSSRWSPQLEMNTSSLEVESDFKIEKGRLINFKPLNSLSKYIELEELQDIKFSTLQNKIIIKDRKIFIPKFDVSSSAIDLALEGTHSFDNEINYRVILIVEQLLGRKIKKPKKEESEFGYIEDDGLGRSKLFLRMTGTIDNPIIKYDTDQLKTHWKNEVQEEKNEVKNILNEEFGIFKNQKQINQNETDTKDTQLPMQIEWDEMPEEEKREEKKEAKQRKEKKKSGFGKFIDKIAEPNQDEFEDSIGK